MIADNNTQKNNEPIKPDQVKLIEEPFLITNNEEIPKDLAEQIIEKKGEFKHNEHNVVLEISQEPTKKTDNLRWGYLYLTDEYLMFLCIHPYVLESESIKKRTGKELLGYATLGMANIAMEGKRRKRAENFNEKLKHPFSFFLPSSNVIQHKRVKEGGRFSRDKKNYFSFVIQNGNTQIPYCMLGPEKKFDKWSTVFSSVISEK